MWITTSRRRVSLFFSPCFSAQQEMHALPAYTRALGSGSAFLFLARSDSSSPAPNRRCHAPATTERGARASQCGAESLPATESSVYVRGARKWLPEMCVRVTRRDRERGRRRRRQDADDDDGADAARRRTAGRKRDRADRAAYATLRG